MASSINFLIQITEKITGGAKTVTTLKQTESAMRSAAKKVSNLESAMRRLNRTGKLGTAQHQRIAGALQRQRSILAGTTAQYAHLATKAGDAGESSGFFAGKMGLVKAGAAAAAAALLAAALAAARFGVQMAASLTKAIVGWAVFRQRSEQAFGLLLKDGPRGKKVLQQVVDLAADLGLPVQATTKQFQKLLAAQFKVGEALDIVKMSADMKALGASTVEVQSVMTALGQIKGKGKLQMEELQGQLAETGLSVKLVIDNLAKSLGKSSDEIRKMISAGEISADQGIEAIKAAVKQKLGIQKLGDAAKKNAGTLEGMWNRFKGAGEKALFDIAGKVLPALMKTFGPIFAELMASFTSADAAAAVNLIADGFKGLLSAVKAAWPIVKALAIGLAAGFKAALPGLKKALSALAQFLGSKAGIEAMATTFKIVGAVVGHVAGELATMAVSWAQSQAAFLSAVGAIKGEISGVSAAIGSVIASISSFTGAAVNAALGLGRGIINGIVSGVKAGAAAVAAAVAGVAKGAISAGAQTLGIKSPSRVFAQLGSYTMQGFEQGVRGESARVDSAVVATVSPPANVANSMQTSTSKSMGPITIHVTGDGAAAIGDELEARIADLFERL